MATKKTFQSSKALTLKYEGGSEAPRISAKGQGRSAEYILNLAKENDIPIVENAPLVNVLEIADVGDIIPEETFEAVAKIFAFVQELEGY